MTPFSTLGLDPVFSPVLTALGISEPTPVQQQAIPLLLAGHDLIATAPTGTGKTAAFLLPAMQRMVGASPLQMTGPSVLVLTPTRELAQQVTKAAHDFGKALPRCRTVCLIGGESYIAQNKALAGPYDILVATPGRLLDQMKTGRIPLAGITMLVLDEADRMLDLGFADDVLAIAKKLPRARQTVCFTATLSDDVRRLSDQLLVEPKSIAVAKPAEEPLLIDQRVYFTDSFSHKRRLLDWCLTDAAVKQAVIFVATKRDADELAASLEADGHPTVALHGDLPQKFRTRMLNVIRRGHARILVATDVAARGLDVPTLTHVFNFDLPKSAEDYVHRIGRTGRAGATGTAVSFVSQQDVPALRKIESFTRHKIEVATVPGLEPRTKPNSQATIRPATFKLLRPAAQRASRKTSPSATKPSAQRRPGKGRAK